MMIKPKSNFSCDKDVPEPRVVLTPQLSSTPQKHDFMHQEKMKRIEMPKPFSL